MVHGEFERNDMVEYFGEQLEGYAFSAFGWVQSYGSRCVKPPLLHSNIQRTRAMTVDWWKFAQSQTSKPVKAMLTGPITLMNWSFVRDDQPLSTTLYQLALALKDEVLDLESAGAQIIQVDEAALREGLPLRKAEWQAYLEAAVDAFAVTTSAVKASTQIHTHMCYSDFNTIYSTIQAMDADVISIETSRSQQILATCLKKKPYPAGIGPGIYDVHSPRIPDNNELCSAIEFLLGITHPQQLWINPDCGLKTRTWEEVIPSLKNLVTATHKIRSKLALETGIKKQPKTQKTQSLNIAS